MFEERDRLIILPLPVRDKQDVLAMCALQFAAQVEQRSIDKDNNLEEIEQKLASLDRLLQDHMS